MKGCIFEQHLVVTFIISAFRVVFSALMLSVLLYFSFQRPTTVTPMEKSCAFLVGQMSLPYVQFQSVKLKEGLVLMETE